eukprot:4790351-Pleurochrysis_carterae.AAC.1
MTKVVTCYIVDLRPATSPGFAQDDGHPNVVVKNAEKNVPPIVPRVKGNAIVVAAGGAVTEFTYALLVPNLDVNLASVEQAM